MSGVTLSAVAGLAGLLAAWMTVVLLVSAPRIKVAGRSLRLKGPVVAALPHLSSFTCNQLLTGIPAPSGFFEQLGPDRMRREFMRNLRTRADSHVDEIMARRTGKAWEGLSSYARNRVYTHVHRRLPYVVDDFVDHLQREVDEMVVPGALVRRWLNENPTVARELFLDAFGPELRSRLPLVALLAAIGGGILARWLPDAWAWTGAAATGALIACASLLALLTMPARRTVLWPVVLEGITRRQQLRYLRALAHRIANAPLAWESVSAELMSGPHSGRLRILIRRQMGGILDTTLFKATLQILLGPEAMVAVKQSAIEKAVELLATTPASPALREGYRLEVERSLLHSAGQVDTEEYSRLWHHTLLPAWRWLPLALAVAGAAGGWLADSLLKVV